MQLLERTSAAKAGWVVAALTIGWLVFLLLPRPVAQKKSKPPPGPLTATSLTRAGLPDYADWAGLPEIFGIWADKAEWKEGKTRFAYWHPVTKSHSYHFEAIRIEGGYRFREIAEPREEGYEWDPGAPEDSPLRLFLPKRPELIVVPVNRADRGAFVSSDPTKVYIELALPPSRPVPPEPPHKAEY